MEAIESKDIGRGGKFVWPRLSGGVEVHLLKPYWANCHNRCGSKIPLAVRLGIDCLSMFIEGRFDAFENRIARG